MGILYCPETITATINNEAESIVSDITEPKIAPVKNVIEY